MGPLDTAAQDASLDNDYGATKGANAPSSHELALFTDDPRLGGVELDATGGYVRVVVTNDGTNWPAASGGMKVGAFQTFPDSTAAWSDTAKWWVLFDHADGTTRWDAGPLDDEIDVNAAGAGPVTRPSIYYNGGL
jgi:hypothetical protein